jgi:hypothetical protein
MLKKTDEQIEELTQKIALNTVCPPRVKIISGDLTIQQDAFCRKIAEFPEKEFNIRELTRIYKTVSTNHHPSRWVRVLLDKKEIKGRIEAYRRVFRTDKTSLAVERELLTKKIQKSWESNETISVGKDGSTPKVKTSDVLTAFKDRENLYLEDAKKDSEITINITGDSKALMERAKLEANIADAEIVESTQVEVSKNG